MPLNSAIAKVNAKFKCYFEYILGILASLMVFREVVTPLIILFVFFGLLNIKNIEINCAKAKLFIFITIPLLLNILFFWNNDNFLEGIKTAEKYLSCLIFPLFIIGQNIKFSLSKVLNIYSVLFSFILIVSLILHYYDSQEWFAKYYEGVEVWRMGYKYALSMGAHAPALNMHVAFLVVVNFYLLLKSVNEKRNKTESLIRFIVFIISVFILVFINTRMAIFNATLGIAFVFINLFTGSMRKERLIKLVVLALCSSALVLFLFIRTFPYTIDKYTKVTFKHLDKIGRLDEFKIPEEEVYNALVTRLTIWKTTFELANETPLIGVGAADARNKLFNAYQETNQKFLFKHKFPVHNQFLDFYLKFGILGFLGVILYIGYIGWLGVYGKNILAVCFFLLFFTSNITDDFLVRFDGIAFSAFWMSVFGGLYWHDKKNKVSPAH